MFVTLLNSSVLNPDIFLHEKCLGNIKLRGKDGGVIYDVWLSARMIYSLEELPSLGGSF